MSDSSERDLRHTLETLPLELRAKIVDLVVGSVPQDDYDTYDFVLDPLHTRWKKWDRTDAFRVLHVKPLYNAGYRFRRSIRNPAIVEDIFQFLDYDEGRTPQEDCGTLWVNWPSIPQEGDGDPAQRKRILNLMERLQARRKTGSKLLPNCTQMVTGSWKWSKDEGRLGLVKRDRLNRSPSDLTTSQTILFDLLGHSSVRTWRNISNHDFEPCTEFSVIQPTGTTDLQRVWHRERLMHRSSPSERVPKFLVASVENMISISHKWSEPQLQEFFELLKSGYATASKVIADSGSASTAPRVLLLSYLTSERITDGNYRELLKGLFNDQVTILSDDESSDYREWYGEEVALNLEQW